MLEIMMVAATGLSPLIAVQVTEWLAKRKDVRGRRISIFHTLMMTREAALSSEHVRALNAIPIEFHGDKKAKAILEAWRRYMDHLNAPVYPQEAERILWAKEQKDLFAKLLYAMAQYFGYDFDETFIRTTAYTPIAHGTLEFENVELRRLLLEVLRGERSLPINPQPAQLAVGGKAQLVTAAGTPASTPTDELKRQLEASEPAKP